MTCSSDEGGFQVPSLERGRRAGMAGPPPSLLQWITGSPAPLQHPTALVVGTAAATASVTPNCHSAGPRPGQCPVEPQCRGRRGKVSRVLRGSSPPLVPAGLGSLGGPWGRPGRSAGGPVPLRVPVNAPARGSCRGIGAWPPGLQRSLVAQIQGTRTGRLQRTRLVSARSLQRLHGQRQIRQALRSPLAGSQHRCI